MNSLLGIRFLALAIAAFAAGSGAAQTPELRVGVSVQMPVTVNAVAVPDADSAGSLIVAVTRNGTVFLEISQVDLASLQAKLKSALASRAAKTVYVKGDARTPFSAVARVLEAVAMAGARPEILLTDQRDASDAGKRPIPPKGLEAQFGGGTLYSGPPSQMPVLIRIEARNAGQGAPALKIGGEQISLAALQTAIAQRTPKGRRAEIALEADGSLLFGDVVRILDACYPLGAKISIVDLRQ